MPRTSAASSADVLVIGGGAAGTLTATALARSTSLGRPIRLTVVEPAADLGRGVAYAHAHDFRLNVPAGAISASADDRDHFLRWLEARQPGAGRTSFATRAEFGRYLAATLDDALARAGSAVSFQHVRRGAAAAEASDAGVRVRLDDGSTIEATAVVVATGLQPPGTAWAPEPLRDSSRFVADPWAPEALDRLAHAARPGNLADVLLVGTGLTAIDLALLLDRPGRNVHAISRRGRLPRAHSTKALSGVPTDVAEFQARMRDGVAAAPATADGIADTVSASLTDGARRFASWQWVLDGVRPITQQTWQRLPVAERAALVRRHGAWWEVHRHRMPPEVATRVALMRSAGRLTVSAAEVVGAKPRDGGLAVRLSDGRRIDVAYVVNCTGPRSDPGGLVAQLLDAGLATPGPLGLGLATEAGRLLDRSGSTAGPLWTLGILRRGELWESTAIPEIRVQAQAVAEAVLACLAR